MFGGHSRTFSARRRRLIGMKAEDLDGVRSDPAEQRVRPEGPKPDGIRIEDNVVVTEQGHDILTDGVPKQIDEIEQLMVKK